MDGWSNPDGVQKTADELHHLLINSITDYAIFSLDTAGNITSWNRGAENLKGYSADEILGRHFSVFYPEDDRASGLPARALAQTLSSGRFEHEGWRVRKDGSKFWAWVVIRAMYDSNGRLKGFAKITRDLTERKRAEDQRLRMAQLEEAARVRDEFLAYVSHEIRGPLSSMHLQLELLRLEKSSLEQLDPILGRLNRSYARLHELVESLLQQSRIRSGRALIRRTPVDLSKMIEEVAEELRPEAADKGLAVSVSPLDVAERGLTMTDPAALRVILLNLVTNAIKFSSKGMINIQLSVTETECRISVRDEGPGISPDDHERIFEPFERVEGLTHKHIPGFGLGLSTSKKLSEALGGRIELSSIFGAGSVFTVVLPFENPAPP